VPGDRPAVLRHEHEKRGQELRIRSGRAPLGREERVEPAPQPAGCGTVFLRDQVQAGVCLLQPAFGDRLKGQDAVIGALGSEQTVTGMRSPTIMSQATPVIIRAMTDTGVSRLVILSALGVGDSYREAPVLLKIIYKLFLGPVYADKAAGERLLRDSALDWALVYPVLLTNGPRTGAYRSGTHLKLAGLPRISRADVADFTLSQVQDPTYHRRPPS
jgi:putative NADH-flavin reductase